MGSSEAAGYVTSDKFLTEWLDELAFAPVDYNPGAPADEWSGDIGCGVQYFSQVGAIRLAAAAGLSLPKEATPAEKLKAIQDLLAKGEPKARKVFESIGCYLGYTLAHYADFYDIRHVLVLGRVVSGTGGNIIMDKTRAILKDEFPDVGARLKIHLPEEESERRVGQAIAAASLPIIKKGGK
jgi:predicted NBD/HSP70 family sugar kinase